MLLTLASVVSGESPTTWPACFANSAGEWVIESSTGTEGHGQVFGDMIGTVVAIRDDRISWVEKWGVDAKGKTNWMRVSRKLVPKPELSPDAVDLVADGPYKAWSRVAILRVDGDEMRLCVNFPQGPRPTKFEKGDDGSELVVLRKGEVGRRITTHCNGPAGRNGPCESRTGRAPGRPLNADPSSGGSGLANDEPQLLRHLRPTCLGAYDRDSPRPEG